MPAPFAAVLSLIQIGDVLSRIKAGVVQHVGVVIDHDRVLTNTPERGEHVCTFEEFAAGEETTVRSSGASAAEIARRALKILGNPRKYNVVLRNCQHTVNEAVSGFAHSQGVAKAAAIVLVAGTYLLKRRMRWR